MVRHTRHETTDHMYLHRRNGVFYFRRRIPHEIASVLTQDERSAFHHSLKTSDRTEAGSLRPGCIAETDEILQLAMARISASRGDGVSTPGRLMRREISKRVKDRIRSRTFAQLSDNEVLKLQTGWFGAALAETRESSLEVHVHWGKEGRADSIEDARYELHHLVNDSDGILAGTLVSQAVEKILDAADCDKPREGLENPLFRRLYSRVHQGLIHLHNTALEILEHGLESSLHSVPVASSGNGSVPGATLDEVIEQFRTDSKRQVLREATREEYEFMYRALRDEFGAKREIASITRNEIREFSALLKSLPARATQRFKGLSVRRMAEETAKQGLPAAHVKTFNKKVHQLSAIFHFAEIEQFIPSSPARNLGIPTKKVPGIGKSFSTQKLNAIFSGSIFQNFVDDPEARYEPGHRLNPCFFWVPLIALFGGMRSNEILQLTVKEGIFVSDKITAFRSVLTVKNQYSYRVVPVHTTLMKIGFARYVEKCRDGGHSRLFPDARTACDGKYSTWMQKPFSRYLKSIGVKDGRQDCLHAFRHNFVEGLRRGDVPPDVRKALTGHSRVDSEEAMYGGEPLERLARYLEKLNYPGVSLSHLYFAP